MPARRLVPLPEGRLLLCPDTRDPLLLQLVRVPDAVISPRETLGEEGEEEGPGMQLERSARSAPSGAGRPPLGLEGLASERQGPLAVEGSSGSGQQLQLRRPPGPLAQLGGDADMQQDAAAEEEGGGALAPAGASVADWRLAVARQWLHRMQPALQQQLERWLVERGGMSALQVRANGRWRQTFAACQRRLHASAAPATDLRLCQICAPPSPSATGVCGQVPGAPAGGRSGGRPTRHAGIHAPAGTRILCRGGPEILSLKPFLRNTFPTEMAGGSNSLPMG